MKKIFVLLTAVAAMGCAVAQGNSKKALLEVNVGVAKSLNYPAISLLSDATDAYSTSYASVLLGYRPNNIMFGIKATTQQDMTTAMLGYEESLSMSSVALAVREYANIGERTQAYVGLDLGLAILHNELSTTTGDIDRTRLGFAGEFELGVQYQLSDNLFVGINGGVDLARCFDKDLDLPATLNATNQHGLNGYRIAISFDTRF